MAVDRREFVTFLALVAAGASALPQQIEAFEKYYEANTPFADHLVAVDEILISGMATRSTTVRCEFFKNDHQCMNFGINTFGGIMRWLAAPDQKIIVSESDFFWHLTAPEHFRMNELIGQISFVNSKYQRKTVQITKLEGSLIDP